LQENSLSNPFKSEKKWQVCGFGGIQWFDSTHFTQVNKNNLNGGNMDQKEVEFASRTQISAELKERAIVDTFEDMLKDRLRKDAEFDGFIETQAPVVFWEDQAWKYVGDEENGFQLVKCSADDEGAFFNVGVRMKVVKNA
jgi:hypothetical protein